LATDSGSSIRRGPRYSLFMVLRFAGWNVCSIISTSCLLCVAALLISIGVVIGMWLGQMKHAPPDRLDDRRAERMHIARDLHDTLLQSIQSLLFHLQLWTGDNSIPEKSRAEISAAVTQARAMVVECRNRLLGLRRDDTERGDLLAALEAIGSAESGGRNVCFKAIRSGKVSNLRPEAYDQLLDIGREAIRNAYRHSRARQIVVAVEFRKRSLRMQIADDGCGIDSSIFQWQPGAGHLGLIGMRERAAQLGTKLLIETNGTAGTLIAVTVAGQIAFVSDKPWVWRLERQESCGDHPYPDRAQ
jgi:signal transduction histidine kinase